jgi:precorrin-2 dehydrogenase/sirohydrochlorin ferrochelatase
VSYFPIFLELSDKSVLVVGGGNVAYRKVVTLLKFTSNVTVIAPHILENIKALGISTFERAFQIEDLSEKYLVITATDDKLLNQQILNTCNTKNILCNSATSTASDNCIFPAVVKQGDIVIGISTSGKSPSVSKKIRQDVERVLLPSLEEYDDKLL